MSDQTKIEWTDCTVNPIRSRRIDRGTNPNPKKQSGWYCQKINEGCANCYAETMNLWRGNGVRFSVDQLQKVELYLDDKVLARVLKMRRPRKIFWCDMTDLFAPFVKDEWIRLILRVMQETPQHTHQILTKRPERMKEWKSLDHPSLFRVWCGASVSDQKTADKMLPHLIECASPNIFVSYEPALGHLNLSPYFSGNSSQCQACGNIYPSGIINRRACPKCKGLPMYQKPRGLGWVIAGGESGPRARPVHPDWLYSIREQCKVARVPFFFKQWGAYTLDKVLAWKHATRRRPLVEAIVYINPDKPNEWREHNAWMYRVSRKTAGRLLSGREWSEFPKQMEDGK